MAASVEDSLPKGEKIRELTIVDILGSGGFGVTYLAEHKGLARLYALKEHFPRVFASREGTTVRPHSHSKGDFDWSRKQFLEEARTLARFKHPSIVHVSNIFEENNTAYMVLDYVEAVTLKEWLRKKRRAPKQQEMDLITSDLLSALEVLHENNTLHRDIAPDNILVQEDGSPMLIDFGSARMAIGGRTKTLTAVVKEGYSPFEQYAADAKAQKPAVDIYALAATLYKAVTGKAPPESINRVEDDEYVPAADAAKGDYREEFLNAIDAGLAVFAKDRPKSVSAWRKMLFAGVEDSPVPDEENSRQASPSGEVSRTKTEVVSDPDSAGRHREDVQDPVPELSEQAVVRPRTSARKKVAAILGLVIGLTALYIFTLDSEMASRIGSFWKKSSPDPVVTSQPAAPPESKIVSSRPPAKETVSTGASLKDLTHIPDIGIVVGLNDAREVEISSVQARGPAAGKNLKVGDVITAVELSGIKSPSDIKDRIRVVRDSQGTVLLMSIRLKSNGERFVAIPLGSPL